MLRALAILMLVSVPAPARAHPHIFVDAELEVIFGAEGAPEAVRIFWTYDPMFSMLFVSDLGLDMDFDGVLTPEEHAELQGFDMNWDEGYHGDAHLTQNEAGLVLGPPQDWTSEYRDGQLRSSHLRRFPDALDPLSEWILAIYDPTYYTSYTLSAAPRLLGREDCRAHIYAPDFAAAGAQLEAALDELLGAGGDIEMDFPMVGALFSQEVRILCPAH